MTHTKNHYKTQGSQTHPRGLGDGHSRYQPGTQRSRVCRCPQKTNCGVTFISWKTRDPHSAQITQTEEPIGRSDSAYLRNQPATHTVPNTKTTTSMARALERPVIA